MFDFIRRIFQSLTSFLKRLFNWDDDPPIFHTPSPAQYLHATIEEINEMANVRLTWDYASPSATQRPIAGAILEGRVVGAPVFTELNRVNFPTNTLLLQDVAPGDWEFRCIIRDSADALSAPVQASLAVPFDAPSAALNFSADVE